MAKIYFTYSSMNSGKTTGLLQSAYNYVERGMSVLLLKPKLDNREGSDPLIKSRIGLESECAFIPDDADELVALIYNNKGVSAIFIDEVQFVPVKTIASIMVMCDAMDIPLLCYGLRNAYDGKGFPGSDFLLRHADKLVECKSICWCGKKATHNMMVVDGEVVRKTTSGGNMVVGGNELYHAVCRQHFFEGKYKDD